MTDFPEPRRPSNGAIDTGYYVQRAHEIRSQDAHLWTRCVAGLLSGFVQNETAALKSLLHLLITRKEM